MARLFGESISTEVVKQLNLRAEILGRDGIRSTNDLRYLSEKTSWIRMISGVDTLSDGSENFNSTQAQKFILSGGELEWDGSKFNRRTGFSSGRDQERGRYSFNDNLGIRPEAGITGFSIAHKNTYGTIREATVNFNVWTLEDLEKAQNLYLRPGMSLIVEWGNSLYLDNDGNVKDTLNIPDQNEYFNKNSFEKIADIIKENKSNNFYNYDGFLGLITNFSWSFRPDGGYDCTVKSVSRGAVLESMSTFKSTSQILSYEKSSVIPSTSDDQDEYSSRTYLHYLVKLFEKANSEEGNVSIEEFTANFTSLFEKESDVPPTLFTYTYSANDKLNNAHFISLNTLSGLLNISYIFKDPSGNRVTSFYTRKNESSVEEPKYVTFNDHFSLDPTYCILPKKPSFSDKIKLNLITDEIINLEKDNLNSVYSIYVNLVKIVEDLDKLYEGDKEPQQANVFDFVKNILNKINLKLGGIANLDLTYDEDIQKWAIIDRDATITFNNEEREKVEQIQITGLKSIASEVSIQTKITSELSSQIAISAQGTKINNTDINSALFTWNSNVVDRFSFKKEEDEDAINSSITPFADVKEKIKNSDTIETQIRATNEEAIQNFEEEIQKLPTLEEYSRLQFITGSIEAYAPLVEVQEVVTGNTFTATGTIIVTETKTSTPQFNEKLFEKFKSEAFVRFKKAVYGTDSDGANTIFSSGLIPIELQLKIDGISGLKIGQIFRIGSSNKPSNILPSIYDKYGFVITGLDSSIENNKWFTTIRGLTFRLEKNGLSAPGVI